MEENLIIKSPDDAIMCIEGDICQEWQDVGRHLGLTDGDIDHINADNQGKSKERCHQMLRKWMKKKGNRATVSSLASALRNSDRCDLADKLEKENLPTSVSITKVVSVSVVKTNEKLDAERPTSCKISRPVIFCCLVAAGVIAMFFYSPKDFENAIDPAKHGNDSMVRCALIQKTIDVALTLLDGVRKIEASWQNFSKGTGQHNLIMGSPNPEEQMLYEEKIRRGFCCYFLPIFRQRHIFTYKCRANETITLVKVIDGWDDDTGGNPEKVLGGPGDCHVEIMVTSKIGRGMDFTFYVFGHK